MELTHLKCLLEQSNVTATGGLTNLEIVAVKGYLGKVRQNSATLADMFEKMEDELFQDVKQQKDDPNWTDRVTDVMAFSWVSKMLLNGCEIELLNLQVQTEKDKVRGIPDIAGKVAQQVLKWALESLLPLLINWAKSPHAPKTVQRLISTIEDFVNGKFSKQTLEKMLGLMEDCADLAAPPGVASALKIAFVALKYLLDLM